MLGAAQAKQRGVRTCSELHAAAAKLLRQPQPARRTPSAAQAKQKGAEWLAEAALHGVMAAIMLPYTAWKVVGLVSSQWGLVLNR